jgi:hypothetical protein
MRRYIEHMKTRPVHHQKAFALGVSGGFTIVLFSIWSFVTLHSGAAIADDQSQNNLAAVTASQEDVMPASNSNDVSSFDNLRQGIEDSYNSVKENVDLSGSYQDARTEGLNNGQQ